MKMLILCAITICTICYVLTDWLDTPVVVKSWSTKKCVTVYSPNDEYKCENLPTIYDVKWTR